jgi:hypothetical protein
MVLGPPGEVDWSMEAEPETLAWPDWGSVMGREAAPAVGEANWAKEFEAAQWRHKPRHSVRRLYFLTMLRRCMGYL